MKTKKVVFQGEPGAFSDEAAHKLLDGRIRTVSSPTFADLFEVVQSRRADCGVIPIENSLIGSIHQNYDLLLEHELSVIGEAQLRIVHCLIAPSGRSLRKINRVYSHPAALDQCRTFFKRNKRLEAIPFYDTAGAVKMVAGSDDDRTAAIASPYAAGIYGMKILRRSIEDYKSNHTRFLLLGRKARPVRGKAKTSVIFSLKNLPGALYKALSVFALRDIDLTKIESRPTRRKKWQYYFYLDFKGSLSEQKVKRALGHLDEITHFIKVLGSYPSKIE